ncbi:MAG TPA: hypothetical protein VFW31_01105, partial [Candidatus Angelobacter sp.]|nr:hypothetical protein [Candidatus Angelobacter sp.]
MATASGAEQATSFVDDLEKSFFNSIGDSPSAQLLIVIRERFGCGGKGFTAEDAESAEAERFYRKGRNRNQRRGTMKVVPQDT